MKLILPLILATILLSACDSQSINDQSFTVTPASTNTPIATTVLTPTSVPVESDTDLQKLFDSDKDINFDTDIQKLQKDLQ